VVEVTATAHIDTVAPEVTVLGFVDIERFVAVVESTVTVGEVVGQVE
jgi:hypothetical protein